MAKDSKDFSMFDDPSFEGFTEKDWERWFKNQHTIPDGTPLGVCKDCIFLLKDNSCMVHDYSAHVYRITKGVCDEKMKS